MTPLWMFYRKSGYLPEAMVNYLALLGWSPPDGVEIRPLTELADLFELTAVKSAPACFDPARLAHVNSVHIKALSAEEFASRAEPFLTGSSTDSQVDDGSAETGPDPNTETASASNTAADAAPRHPECYDRETVRLLASDVQQRITTLAEAVNWIDWIFRTDISYDAKSWRKVMVKGKAVEEVLAEAEARLADDDFSSASRLESIVMGIGDELTARMGVRVRSQPPVRVALSGRVAGLPLWEPMRLLGRDRTLDRLRYSLTRLRQEQGKL